MIALLKNDLFLKFAGGFAIGLIGIATLQTADARMQRPPHDATQSVRMIDATL